MKSFADTSFLCALYRAQSNSANADRLFKTSALPVFVSSLVLYEFRQGLRLEAFRFRQHRAHGFSEKEIPNMLMYLDANMRDGAIEVEYADWPEVYDLAERLSAQYTISNGHRAMDIIHVATALHVKAAQFLTFDENQALLAKKAGLKINLK